MGKFISGEKVWLPKTDGETKCKKRESQDSEQMFLVEGMLHDGSTSCLALRGPLSSRATCLPWTSAENSCET